MLVLKQDLRGFKTIKSTDSSLNPVWNYTDSLQQKEYISNINLLLIVRYILIGINVCFQLYLAVPTETSIKIFKWLDIYFDVHQEIYISGTQTVQFFTVEQSLHLAVASKNLPQTAGKLML